MRCTTPATQIGLGLTFPHPKDGLFKSSIISRRPTNLEGVALEDARDHVQDAPLLLEVRPSAGRGLGLFAVAPIAAYTKVLEDDALISIAHGEDLPELWAKYQHLAPQQKQVFDELSSSPHLAPAEQRIISALEQRGYDSSEARSMAQVNSRWQSNAFKTEAATFVPSHPWAYALFGTVARINHSCTPNASTAYQVTGTQVVYALHDIKAGDEIEIAYLDITMAKSDRQARSQSWGFRCSCPACSGSDKFVDGEYERYVSYLHQQKTLHHSIGDAQKRIDAMQKAISVAHSTEYPWLVSVLPHLYIAVFHLQIRAQSPKEKVRESAVKALEWQRRTAGPGSLRFELFAKMLKEFDAGNEASISQSTQL